MNQHWPAIAGCEICYYEGDEVTTRDSRKGIVLGKKWEHDLTIYKDGIPRRAFSLSQ